MYFVYRAPEYSTIYDYENSNGIELLNDNILNIAHAFSDASLILSEYVNARTKDLQECIIHYSIEQFFQDANDHPPDDFSFKRKSKDCSKLNKYGRSLIELWCTHSIHVLNGRVSGDLKGGILHVSPMMVKVL